MSPSSQFAVVTPADFVPMEEARAAMQRALAPAAESIQQLVSETYAPVIRAFEDVIGPTLERIEEMVLAVAPAIAQIARAHADALRLADLYVLPVIRLQRQFAACLIPAMTIARRVVADLDTERVLIEAAPPTPYVTQGASVHRRMTLTERQLLWALLTLVIAWMVAACVLDDTIRPAWLAFAEQHVYAEVGGGVPVAGYAIKRLRDR